MIISLAHLCIRMPVTNEESVLGKWESMELYMSQDGLAGAKESDHRDVNSGSVFVALRPLAPQKDIRFCVFILDQLLLDRKSKHFKRY